MKKLRICMAQIEVIPGNPTANTQTMLNAIEKAKTDKADVICFSELCVPGYVLGDMWERKAFIDECLECGNQVVKASDGIVVIFGNIYVDERLKNEDGRIRKYNTAIIAANGFVVDRRIKTLQPNYREFDDNRHFYDYRKVMFDQIVKDNGFAEIDDFLSDNYQHSITINDIKISCMLCEDGWDTDYTFSPASELFPNCDIVFNLSCSPFTYQKADKRNRVFSNQAKKYGKPLVYVNCVGVQNNGKTIYTFDGDSCIYDKEGNQFNPYTKFDDGCETFEIDIESTFSNNTTLKTKKVDHFTDIGVGYDTFKCSKDDIGTLHKSIIYGCKKFMESVGIKKVVIGASGGIDSAVVATIMHEIVGKDNLILVNMPSRFNSNLTKDAAKQLATTLGCRYIVHPIQDSVDLTTKEIYNKNFVERYETVDGITSNIIRQGEKGLSDFAIENVQARDRSSRILAAWASWFGGAFTCNANKSEMTVGYTTLYGDLGGFMAPISDLWKGQVYELARYINDINGCEVIPLSSIDVVPSAELSDKQDVTKGLGDPLVYPYHDKLFASWVEKWDRASPEDILRWYLNGTLAGIIGYDGDIYLLFPTVEDFIRDLEKWWNCYNGLAVAKRIQAPPVLAVSRRAFGFDHRETQVSPYYTKAYKEMKERVLSMLYSGYTKEQSRNRFYKEIGKHND